MPRRIRQDWHPWVHCCLLFSRLWEPDAVFLVQVIFIDTFHLFEETHQLLEQLEVRIICGALTARDEVAKQCL